eukprot:TRINITY_DN2512_c0_g1_i1.p1 TRINITY_DN2512_c0_g1~~TRINITY_DN2512_c0_g1_i1.p1  ORF type:complete len:1102 (-),score=182.41 TRINITY_DN2512_c0_g1_i1:93-3398(-)
MEKKQPQKGGKAKGEVAVKPFVGGSKRDLLLEMERDAKAHWAAIEKEEGKGIFDVDAPTEGDQPKFMVTFPYPYMNGRLHLGHTFTISKAEFAAGYHALKGHRSLFPFAFHCTGMPIRSCADKLRREIDTYGNPPQFPAQVDTPAEQKPAAKTVVDPTKAVKGKKAKVVAKTGVAKHQWQIMEEMDVASAEIANFADPQHWIQYFPPHCQSDLRDMGVRVDWRRSFITTDTNPFYDSFVRWQFETLKDMGKIKFGKRYTIYSPKDGGPCADHDRHSSSEGIQPQDYTLIKLEVVAPFPEKLKSLEGKKVYLVPATLRPETMYGQTNCFVLPTGTYGAYEINDSDVFICGAQSALNLSFQGYSKEWGKPSCLLEVTGQDLIGLPLHAPLATYPVVYTLPMKTILTTKATGVVTSVPSDAPDDYVALMDLKTDAKLREKFHVKEEWVMPFEVVPIIDIPGFGSTAAVKVCQERGIKDQHDKLKLEEAKKEVYLKGFNDGVLLVGDHKGEKVSVAKDVIRQELIDRGLAIPYSEPADPVTSRSGDTCVCALCDQWYIEYGEDEWKAATEKVVESMELYSPEVRAQFEATLGWLREWACSRSYGLGTQLPWDTQYLVDSLSDSTIYMAFYTIAHLLQGPENVYGQKPGPSGIKPEQMTRHVWDYIFDRTPEPPKDTEIPREVLDKMRREFTYWYPVNLRVSGKDLVPNHLTFFIYNHVAFWPTDKCPQGIRANGHLLLNSKKMSKADGNFITLRAAMDLYSVTAMRFTLADAGDSVSDANFSNTTAETAVLRLVTQYDFIKEMLEGLANLTDDEPSTFEELAFLSAINRSIVETDTFYKQMKFHEALRTGFFELQNARDSYRTAAMKMNKQVILKFIRTQLILLTPVCPHYCEYIWTKLWLKYADPEGKEVKTITRASWPEAGAIDEDLLRKTAYLDANLHDWRLSAQALLSKKGNIKQLTLFVATDWPDWQKKALVALQGLYRKETNDFPEDYKKQIAALFPNVERPGGKSAPPPFLGKMFSILESVADKTAAEGVSAMSVDIPFQEYDFLAANLDRIKRSLPAGIEEIILVRADEPGGNEAKKAAAIPLKPAFQFGADPVKKK